MTLLQLNAVTRRYGALTAVDQVTLTLNPGDRLAITGPNGAGKSTLLGLIDGTLPATGGQIRYNGIDITRWPPHRRAGAGIARVFQHPMIAQRHTVLGNIRLAVHRQYRLGGRVFPPRPAVARLLSALALDVAAQVGLTGLDHTPAGQLSYGHRRQLDLAVALACKPRLLLLDEPTAGLSGDETHRITTLLQRLPATLAVIIVEHDTEVVEAIARTVLRLDTGRTSGPAQAA